MTERREYFLRLSVFFSEPNMKHRFLAATALCLPFVALEAAEPDSLVTELREVTVRTRGVRKLKGATNSELITAKELKRAACCNLGESFATNPSVDVNYSDAATGARQIRLLGLSGAYVQMLTENIPNFRGAAMPYGLGYIAGPWMQSISVSKGASSVKNGYESITGQINIEMKKPQADPSFAANLYYDSMNKLEANLDGNLHLGEKWSGGILFHAENSFTEHDGNDDGFMDQPRVRQVAAMNRWAYLGENYVFQAAVKFLDEERVSGQSKHHTHGGMPLYIIDIDTHRWEAFTKNAYIFDHENDGNIALIVSGSYHDQDASYGHRIDNIAQTELYGSLMFERKWLDRHSLSVGLNGTYDDYHYHYRLRPDQSLALSSLLNKEGIGGAYGQYTFNLDERLVAMAGLRYDYNSDYGSLFTPRMHLRWNPTVSISAHASAGRGYRSPQPLAEYSYLLASSRTITIAPNLHIEDAWNFGIGGNISLRPFSRKLDFTAEYYYTRFGHQLMVDLDTDPHAATIFTSANRSFSHAFQLEATCEPFYELTLAAAWRLTDVKQDYGFGLTEKPLTSKHKGLISASYAPMMGLWQFDVTCSITGGGRMPRPYTMLDGALSWPERYSTFAQLSAQITRNFRNYAIYLGGENITGYRQKNPIIGASDPWGSDFDATMVYAPLHGAMFYVGFRYNFTKYI